MKHTVKKAYWLFLAVATSIFCVFGLLPNDSYASFRNEAVWETGLQTSAVKVTADYLHEDGQTVLMKDLTQSRTVRLVLTANREALNGTLSCSVSPQNAATVAAPQTVTVTDAGTVVELVLTPNAVAQDTNAVLSVSWTTQKGQSLRGNFHFTVPAEGAQQENPTGSDKTVSGVTMSAMKQFAPGSAVALTVKYPLDSRQIRLSLAGEAFPAGTRYSTEYDSRDVLLYDPAQICLETDGTKQMTVLVTLPADSVANTVTFRANVIGTDSETPVQAQSEPISGALLLPNTYFYKLTDGSSFTVPFPGGWTGCTLSYTVQKLTQTEEGFVYETNVSAESQGLSVVNNTSNISVTLTGSNIPAGTYRLLLVWNYQIYTVAQREVTFHVSYPERVTAQTGGNAT